MLSFLGKKEEQPKPKPTYKRIRLLKRIVNCFELGQRIRYHVEFERQDVLESLVMGYCINDHMVFKSSDISFMEDEKTIKLVLDKGDKKIALNRIEKIQVILPGDMGEEKKLDHHARSNLGRKGPFSRNNRLVIMSTNVGKENLMITSEVARNLRLKDGVHAGHHVVMLELDLSSVETYELRATPRISTQIPILLHKEGEEVIVPGLVQDISEYFLNVSLQPPQIPWPELTRKDSVIIAFSASEDKPQIKLRCMCVRKNGANRVFEITEIYRQSEFVTFQMIDAMQLKIELMHLSSE